MVVAASWSCEELAAMMRAWDDALDVPPHRGFRLLEHMFRRFTELRGGATDRTVGSMKIKRKYMRNMVDVIARFNNLHGRNGDGQAYDGDAEDNGSSAITGGTGTVDNTSLVVSQQQLRWFEMKRSERKQWFLRLNAKSYKFANIDEYTFSSVYKLMQIERLVYGSTGAGEEDEAEQEGRQHASSPVSGARKPLARDAAGDWARRPLGEVRSGPTTAPGLVSETNPTTAMSATASTRVPAESGARPLRRDDSAFDRLLASSSGQRGDVVMIDAGTWSDASDDSDTDGSGDSEEDGDDGDDDNSYDWGQATHVQHPGERGVRNDRRPHETTPEQVGADRVSQSDNLLLHSDQTGLILRSERQQQRLADPQLFSAVHSLEAQAAELREFLAQEREGRQQEEQLWGDKKLRRDHERLKFTESIAQITSTQDKRRLNQEEDTKLRDLRTEVLALIRSEEVAWREEDETKKLEQDRLLWEIKRDNRKRMKFDRVHRDEQAVNGTLVEMLQQIRSKRQRKITERAEILKQIKSIQSGEPQDQQPIDSGKETGESRNSDHNGEVAADRTNEAENLGSKNPVPERRRSLRGSKAAQDGDGKDPEESEVALRPSRTRRK